MKKKVGSKRDQEWLERGMVYLSRVRCIDSGLIKGRRRQVERSKGRSKVKQNKKEPPALQTNKSKPQVIAYHKP